MKTSRIALTAVLALALGALVPATAAQASDDPIVTGTVTGPSGVVDNMIVGWIDPATGTTSYVRTDSEGEYQLANPGNGSPYVLFTNVLHYYSYVTRDNDYHPDYNAEYFGAGGTSDYLYLPLAPFPAATGPSVENLTVTKLGSISGIVPALAGDDIRLENLNGESTGYTTIGSDGAYEFADLVPGRYRVIYSDYDWPQAYADYASAPVAVTAGETTTFVPTPSRTAKIAGTVKSGSTKIKALQITATNTAGLYYETTSTAAGNYTLEGLKAGSYTVTYGAVSSGSTSTGYIAKKTKATVNAAGTLTSNQSLVKGGTITGALTLRSKGDNTVVITAANSKGVQVARVTQPESKTTFSLKGLPTGTYTVTAIEAGSSYRQATVKVTAGKSVSVGKLVTNKSTLTLSGTAKGSYRVDATSPADIGGTAWVTESGKYSIRGLVPGKYTVTVQAGERDDKVYTAVALSKTTTKNLSLGTKYGTVTATLQISGNPVTEGYGGIMQGKNYVASYSFPNGGALSTKAPAGSITFGSPAFYGNYMVRNAPFWYAFPASSRTVTLASGATKALGVVELELKR